MGDEIAINGYTDNAFNWFATATSKDKVDGIEDNEYWKIVIPSFIDNKPVTKISKNFIEQNLIKSSRNYDDLSVVEPCINSAKYSPNKRNVMVDFVFKYANDHWDYVGYKSPANNSSVQKSKFWDYSASYYKYILGYGNLYSTCTIEKEQIGKDDINFSLQIMPIELIIPSSVNEIIESNLNLGYSIKGRKKNFARGVINVELDLDDTPIPSRPTKNSEVVIDFSNISPSSRAKFVFLDREDLSDLENSAMLENVNENLSIQYKDF